MTSRQFYFVIIVFTICLKIQKMPCLLYNYLGKDSFFLILLFLVLDLIGIIIAYLFAKKMQKNDLLRAKSLSPFGFVVKFALILTTFYFFMQAMLFYEAIQDLFSHILFDNSSWTLFSLFLIFAIFYLASSGLKIIGRNFEVYFAVIILSLIVLAIFGSMHTDFTSILPLQTLFAKNFWEAFKTFNLWFGDFVLIFFLTINSKGTKLKFTVLSYVISMLFVMLLFLELNGLFFDFTPVQPSLISIISEQALLGVDIGRLDWFCILISEMGTVLCSALCLCFATKSVKFVFPKVKPNIVLFCFSAVLYLIDVFYLVDRNAKTEFFMNFGDIYALVLKIAIFVILTIINVHFCLKQSKKKRANVWNNMLKNI